METAILIIFGGLPGTGKTTIAKKVAKQLKAVYLRADTIEQALKNLTKNFIGPEGYLVSYAIAKENLNLGLHVVTDSVNPIAITRKDWQEVANSVGVKFLEIEISCSNENEHKKRAEARASDILGHKLPAWDEIKTRNYEEWESPSLRIDTAIYSADEAVKQILQYLDAL